MVLAAIYLSACSPSKGPENVDASSASKQPGKTEWTVQELTAPSGAVKATVSVRSNEAIEGLKRTYRQSALIPVPVDPKYNVQLFRIRGSENADSTIYIAPRLFAYGSAQRGSVAPQDNRDGTVSLSFPLALIDGGRENIKGADDKLEVPVPKELRIQDIDALRKELNERFQKPQVLSGMPGCPSRITLTVNDRAYDATPKGMSDSNFCQLNQAIQAPLRVTLEDARFIFQEALYAGAVKAQATFETEVPFIISSVKVRFDKRKVFQDLNASLNVHAGPFADVDIKIRLTQILQRQAMGMDIQGAITPAVESAVKQATALFFEPFRPEPGQNLPACKDATVCLRINYARTHEEGSFDFEWNNTANALTGQHYTTWATMQPVQDRVVMIGGDKRPALRNDGTDDKETGLTVVNGTQLEITPSELKVERPVMGKATSSRSSNVVCAQTGWRYSGCRGGKGCWEGGGAEDSRYEVCLKREDQWVETISYADMEKSFDPIPSPVGTVPQLFEGLALRFRWTSTRTGQLKESVCAATAFPYHGDGRSILLTLSNIQGCEIFGEDSKNGVMVHLVNNIQFPIRYRVGRDYRYWDGRYDSSQSHEEVYLPEVYISGTISVRGFDMMGVFANTGVKR